MFPYNFKRSHVRAIRGHSLCPARCLDHSSTRFQSNQAKTLQARAAALQQACRHLASKGATRYYACPCPALCSHSWFLLIQWGSACFTGCAFQDACILDGIPMMRPFFPCAKLLPQPPCALGRQICTPSSFCRRGSAARSGRRATW